MNPQRESQAVFVDHVKIGGGAGVVIQSMTDTDTTDVKKTVEQIKQLADAGSELVRLTVNTDNAAQAIVSIRDQLDEAGYHRTPLVGDFHYNGHLLLTRYPQCAQALAKYRINPGNVGFGRKKDVQFAQIIECAIRWDKPVRIGVNWGSLDQQCLAQLMDENARRSTPMASQMVLQEALIRSALDSAAMAEQIGLAADRIIISCKVSSVADCVSVYRQLAKRCSYPLHLGLTEAGMGDKGVVSSSVGIGCLLLEGIGDTVRVSLTPKADGDRRQEVKIAQLITQVCGIRAFTPQVTACPGCGRTSSDRFKHLTEELVDYIEAQMPQWKVRYPGVESLTLAVMGCVVNGPGESRHVNIGISLPGSGESPAIPVFIDGEKAHTLRGDQVAEQIKVIILDYIQQRFGQVDA